MPAVKSEVIIYSNNKLLITTLLLSVYKMGGFFCRLCPLRKLGAFLSGCSIPSTYSIFWTKWLIPFLAVISGIICVILHGYYFGLLYHSVALSIFFFLGVRAQTNTLAYLVYF